MKKLIIVLTLFSGAIVYCQQDPMFTHYMYNTLAVNPAYVGSREALTITGLNRAQWVGFDGAPLTQTVTMHTPVHEYIGIGASVIQDKIGPISNSGFFGDIAVRIRITKSSKLAVGIKGGLNLFNVDLTSLIIDEQNDVSFYENIENVFLPNFGFGLYYSREKFYAGVSVPKILQQNYYKGTSIAEYASSKEQLHFYFISGAIINLSSRTDFKPSTLLKITEGAPAELDVTGLFEFHKLFNVGLMYRTGDGVGMLCGFNISEQLTVGYSYDFSFAKSSLKYNQGSHEIIFRYDFFYGKNHRIKSPRYF